MPFAGVLVAGATAVAADTPKLTVRFLERAPFTAETVPEYTPGVNATAPARVKVVEVPGASELLPKFAVTPAGKPEVLIVVLLASEPNAPTRTFTVGLRAGFAQKAMRLPGKVSKTKSA